MQCPACRAEVLATSRFCPACGAALAVSAAATMAAAPGAERPPSTDSLDRARFVPGTMLAGRYRIVALLGRGGMGDVYRAEDLKLGQPVALKFLPEQLAHHPDRLARFHQEVRVARQVSHPNVCRVYDIGEADGQHFLSMEYVNGEDLASLIRRIGRLPVAKATELARQICAGLAAAHDRGVLHRDLKPANVLIDERGRAHLADFGLAGIGDDGGDRGIVAGTPGYMAPEQYAGAGTSVRSDIYALGLVLYELYTGVPAIAVDHSKAPHVMMAALADPVATAPPSTLATDIDPSVDRVILRCLERDPARRPSSAIAVAAALPGGDPLAAALAAGETPSPAMVAASRDTDMISMRTIALNTAWIVVGLVIAAVLTARTSVLGQTPFELSPAALEQKARDLIRALGYTEPPTDRGYGLVYDTDFRDYAARQEPLSTYQAQLKSGRPAPVRFWYRQSPSYLVPLNAVGSLTPTNPPMTKSGMIRVFLDPQGRLLQLHAVPQQVEEAPAAARSYDWTPLLTAAGLDQSRFSPAEPKWVPQTPFDLRAAWTGSFVEAPDIPMRVEAAAWRGAPVYFEIVGPWTRPRSMEPVGTTAAERGVPLIFQSVVLLILGVAVLLAWRHMKEKRADGPGATRLAIFMFIATVIDWIVTANHVPTGDEINGFAWGVSSALYIAGLTAVLYLALEPHVRRRWPHSLVTWTRVLAGDVRDPMVGAHLLIGIAFGVAYTILFWATDSLRFPGPSFGSVLASISTPSGMLAMAVNACRLSIPASMGLFFFFFLLRSVLRRPWLAAVVFTLVFTAFAAIGDANAGIALLPGLLNGIRLGLAAIIVVRFGILPMVLGFFVGTLLGNVVTLDFSAWYSGSTIFALAIVAALTAFSVSTALGGRRARFLETS